jgi:hypothetical protein
VTCLESTILRQVAKVAVQMVPPLLNAQPPLSALATFNPDGPLAGAGQDGEGMRLLPVTPSPERSGVRHGRPVEARSGILITRRYPGPILDGDPDFSPVGTRPTTGCPGSRICARLHRNRSGRLDSRSSNARRWCRGTNERQRRAPASMNADTSSRVTVDRS